MDFQGLESDCIDR